MKTGRSAFTLIELMVTVVVIGVLAAIVLSAVVDTVDAQAEVNAREILSAIRFAKVVSLSQRDGHKVIFDATQNSVRVEDSLGAVAWNPVTYSGYEWQLEHGRIDLSDFNGSNTLEFGSSGESQWGGSVVVTYEGDLTQTFTVSPITARTTVVETRD